MTDRNAYSSWGRYDHKEGENAMYLSKTLPGNKTELVPHYGRWDEYNTYKFDNVSIGNLLDLTDDAVRQKVGVNLDAITKITETEIDMYDIPNTIAEWARKKGYNGIIAPGTRGVKDYENIILFNQNYIDDVLKHVPSDIKPIEK
ncbi:MAG: hypothetical protein LBG19_11415 [Prevotellaceae bacterium]|jgi:RES domain-containing protein|nr:hypothetical protein [Prevotellaceae bacterium]